MALSQAYLNLEAKIKEEGRRETLKATLESLFQTRFGQIDDDLRFVIEQALALSNDEYNQLFPRLLTLSREALIQSLTTNPDR